VKFGSGAFELLGGRKLCICGQSPMATSYEANECNGVALSSCTGTWNMHICAAVLKKRCTELILSFQYGSNFVVEALRVKPDAVLLRERVAPSSKASRGVLVFDYYVHDIALLVVWSE